MSLPKSLTHKKPKNLTLKLNNFTNDEKESTKESGNAGSATIDLQNLDIFSNNKANNLKKNL